MVLALSTCSAVQYFKYMCSKYVFIIHRCILYLKYNCNIVFVFAIHYSCMLYYKYYCQNTKYIVRTCRVWANFITCSDMHCQFSVNKLAVWEKLAYFLHTLCLCAGCIEPVTDFRLAALCLAVHLCEFCVCAGAVDVLCVKASSKLLW